MTVLEQVDVALDAVPTTDADRGAVELARTYARAIDEGAGLDRLGPALLAALTALGMTPAARAALVKGARGEQPATSPLDELRQRRAARQRGTEAVDTAAG